MPTDKFSILVVDDEEDIVDVTRASLESRGLATDGAHCGAEALEKLRRQVPDVLLLDLSMPGMSGNEVIREVRAEERLRHLPIVILSALVDGDNIVKAFDDGADDYVTKPPDFGELAARLRRHAQAARERAAGPAASAAGPTAVTTEADLERLKTVEAAIKQIALAAKLAQDRDGADVRLQCLQRIQSFCTVAVKVLTELLDPR